MYDKSVTATGLGSLVTLRAGRGYCARCGMEMKVRPEVALHVCDECRRDKVWLKSVRAK